MSDRTRIPYYLLISCLLINLSYPNNSDSKNDKLKTVDLVDIDKYVGIWYEIARIPNKFQKKCASNVKATYKLRNDSKIEVTNSCQTADGSVSESKGIAKIIDTDTNAKLKVSFVRILGFSLFWGDYWIIGLEKQYQYAIVGTPSRKYGWILSREPILSDANQEKVFSILREQGYQPEDFVMTVHGY
jgi:apolipoprotein D and lipocalin family protein